MQLLMQQIVIHKIFRTRLLLLLALVIYMWLMVETLENYVVHCCDIVCPVLLCPVFRNKCPVWRGHHFMISQIYLVHIYCYFRLHLFCPRAWAIFVNIEKAWVSQEGRVFSGGDQSRFRGFPFPQRPTIQGNGPRGRVIENWAGREEPGLGLTERTGPPQGNVLSKVYMLPRFHLYEALYLYSCLTCLWVRMGVHTSVGSFIGWRQVWGVFFFFFNGQGSVLIKLL